MLSGYTNAQAQLLLQARARVGAVVGSNTYLLLDYIIGQLRVLDIHGHQVGVLVLGNFGSAAKLAAYPVPKVAGDYRLK